MDDTISRQAAIDTEGLDEEIRCEMCKNPMHTDRGCDGHCKYDEKLYERIMQILDERIKPLPSAQPEPCEDAVSREAVKELAYSQIRSMYCGVALKEQRETMLRIADNVIGLLAPVASKQSEIIRCKDCQYWNKGSCECPEHAVNCQDYYVGDIETEAEYFCGYAERREVAT